MAKHFQCRCPERKEPWDSRRWRVSKRKYHESSRDYYQKTPSDWSTVICLRCGASGRTKAGYVDRLSDLTEEEYSKYCLLGD